jgi:hypothetical protein
MEPDCRALRKRLLFLGLFVCVILVIGGSLRNVFDSHLVLKPFVSPPKPPLSPAVSMFSCINSSARMNHTKRVAVLHGPDWILESSIEPSCFPERDLVFSAEVGKQFLPHPVTARSRLWVTKNRDVICVRIVDSSGDNEQDIIAIGLGNQPQVHQQDQQKLHCKRWSISSSHVSGLASSPMRRGANTTRDTAHEQ